jgi:hypothetical protein
MERESRANLIFLVIFLGLSIPGVVILVMKKSDPRGPRLALPDSPIRRLPYMTPLQTPGDVTRYVPPLTGQWVKTVAHELGNIDNVLTRKWQPIVSDDYVIQALGVRPGTPDSTVMLLVWGGDYAADVNGYSVKAASADQAVPARVTSARAIPMSDDLRHELMNDGYFHPPQNAIWLEIAIGDTAPIGKPLTLQISRTTGLGLPSIVKVFTIEDFQQK